MRNVWVDAGNDPDWEVVEKHQATGLFWDVREERLTPAYLADAFVRGYDVGVYVVDNWDGWKGLAGSTFARRMHERVEQVAGEAGPSFPRVQFDLERHDPTWILACLQEWRRLRPRQNTSWTFEAMQGGWMSDDFVRGVLGCRVRLVPQAYTGDMRRFAEDATLRNLTRRGFPEGVISLFYDAADLPLGWDGYAFTMGRLPR